MSVNAAVFPVPGNCSQFQYNMLDLGRQPGFSKWEPGSYLVNENFVPGPWKLSSQFLYNMLFWVSNPDPALGCQCIIEQIIIHRKIDEEISHF